MEVQGRRKRGRPERRWLDRMRGDIEDSGLSREEVYYSATWMCYSSSIDPHKSGTKMKMKKKMNRLTSIDVGLDECPDGMNAALKVVWCYVDGVAHQERESLATLDERLRIVVTQLFIQHNVVLVDRHLSVVDVRVVTVIVYLT